LTHLVYPVLKSGSKIEWQYRSDAMYITTKNRKNTPGRLEIKKYNPIMRKYTLHKEIK